MSSSSGEQTSWPGSWFWRTARRCRTRAARSSTRPRFLRWYAEEAVRLDGSLKTAPSGPNKITALYQPVGVSYMITPWNFPAAMATRKIGLPRCRLHGGAEAAKETPLSALAVAADYVTNCSMGLGGNAPFLVFDDADIDAAVDGAFLAKMRKRRRGLHGSQPVLRAREGRRGVLAEPGRPARQATARARPGGRGGVRPAGQRRYQGQGR
jgi:hypothetical protein